MGIEEHFEISHGFMKWHASSAMGTWVRPRRCKRDTYIYIVVGRASTIKIDSSRSDFTSRKTMRLRRWGRRERWWIGSSGATTKVGTIVGAIGMVSLIVDIATTNRATTKVGTTIRSTSTGATRTILARGCRYSEG